MATDAFTLLEEDHRRVEKLFREYEGLTDRSEKRKRDIVRALIRELAMHSAIEEQLVYPAIRNKRDAFEESVLEALEEHLVVKWTLAALDDMKPRDERYDAKVTILRNLVEHHVEEEEGTLFPAARRAFRADELEAIAKAILAMKKIAPTRPHPRAPDTPPGNLIVGTVASMMDRGRDLLTGRKPRPVPSAARPGRKAVSSTRAAAKTARAKSRRKRR